MSKYNFLLDLDENTSTGKLLRYVKPNSRVLEFGPAHGRMTRYMKEELNCDVYIVEIDSEAFADAMKFAKDGICGDISEYLWCEKYSGIEFDCIMFADVLEHLYNPEQVLKKTQGFLKEDGFVIFSVPNIGHNDILMNLYNNIFEYTSVGLLDTTHIRFFAYNTLAPFCRNAGYEIVEEDAITAEPFSTEQNCWVTQEMKTLFAELTSDRKLHNIYQFVCKLQKEEYVSEKNIIKTSKILHNVINVKSSLFFDRGEGFNESDKLVVSPDKLSDYSFFYHINTEPTIKSIRFDPVEGKGCIVKNMEVLSNNGPQKISNLNGIRIENYDVFTNTDPQFLIDFEGKETSWIKIKADIISFKREDAIISELSMANESLMNEIRDKSIVIEKLSEENKNFDEKIKAISQELNYNSAMYETTVAQRDNYYNMYETTVAQRDNYYKMYETTVAQRDNYYNMYSTISNAMFWKITAPMRSVIDKFKKTKIGNLVHKTFRYLKLHGIKETMYKVMLSMRTPKRIPQVKSEELGHGDWTLKQMLKFSKQVYHGRTYLEDELKKLDGHGCKGLCVLLIGHDMGLTGAPVALYNFAKVLKKNGNHPVIIVPSDGNLRKTICREDIPVIVMECLYSSDFIARCAPLFDLIVVNTIVGYPIIKALSGAKQPVLWWIHEANASYPDNVVSALPEFLPRNIHVYCGGSYAEKLLLSYRPTYRAKQLLYCVADYAQEMIGKSILPMEHAENKTVFAIVGMQEERKGQDVLADAILSMPREQVERCIFVFVGRKSHPYVGERVVDICTRYPDNTKYIEELSPNDLRTLYMQMDCLICASKDDPMPIVVSEALMLSKLVICSEHTGSASLLQEMKSGLVFANNAPKLLAGCIYEVLDKKDRLDDMRACARATYERYFSEDIFCVKVEEILSTIGVRVPESEEPFQVTSNSLRTLARNFNNYIADAGDALYGYNVMEQYDNNIKGKRVLIISHELSLTGAPIAVHYLAQCLKELGDCPVILSPFDGKMREEIVGDGVPVIIYNGVYATDFLANNAFCFDLIILNTVVTFRAVNQLAESKTPVIWWIHDSDASYSMGGFEKILPVQLPKNVSIYCGGEYAKDRLLHYYPNYSSEIFLYYVPDYADMAKHVQKYPLGELNGKMLFSVIGLQDKRKGHDILVQAVKMLELNEIERCMFLFVGQRLEPDIYECIMGLCKQYPDFVKYIPEVSRKELISIYDQSSCVICSSRDDPMPIFATEAMLMSKLVICSENTGTAALIRQTGGGLIYKNNDPRLLLEQIRYILEHHDKLDDMRVKARMTYETYFSKTSFVEKVSDIIAKHSFMEPEENYFNGMVSVVIPTYNAGESFSSMLELLLAQKGIRQIEVIVVDSGSSDGTVERCFHTGVKLIQISKSEFTHSYARNLGASKSHGDILLFMTQDAMPTSTWWMYHIVEPVIKENIAAVGCKEVCPEGTELYYRVASQVHAKFLGIDTSDVVCSIEKCVDSISLRANAGLNDITCAVNRLIFDRFGYRFDYAEDLDLGVRLIKKGYKLKLLTSEQVLHGHNRMPNYYMRRALLESWSLATILGRTVCFEKEKTDIVALRIVKSYASLLRILQQLRKTIVADCLVDDFFTILGQTFVEHLGPKYNKCMPEYGLHHSDVKVEEVVQMMEDYCAINHFSAYDIVHNVKYYCEHHLQPFLCQRERVLNTDKQEQVYDCIYKQTALMIGTNLAHIDGDANLLEKIKALTKGV